MPNYWKEDAEFDFTGKPLILFVSNFFLFFDKHIQRKPFFN